MNYVIFIFQTRALTLKTAALIWPISLSDTRVFFNVFLIVNIFYKGIRQLNPFFIQPMQSNKKNALDENLNPQQIRETHVNEPLINWHSIDGDLALSAISSTRGWAAYASDRAMISYSKRIREREGLSVLPASTSSLIALIDLHKKEQLSNDRYVVILTGRK